MSFEQQLLQIPFLVRFVSPAAVPQVDPIFGSSRCFASLCLFSRTLVVTLSSCFKRSRFPCCLLSSPQVCPFDRFQVSKFSSTHYTCLSMLVTSGHYLCSFCCFCMFFVPFSLTLCVFSSPACAPGRTMSVTADVPALTLRGLPKTRASGRLRPA